jgi:hypothetical protein
MTTTDDRRQCALVSRPTSTGPVVEFFLDLPTQRAIDERAAANGETRGDVIRRFIGIGLELDDRGFEA